MLSDGNLRAGVINQGVCVGGGGGGDCTRESTVTLQALVKTVRAHMAGCIELCKPSYIRKCMLTVTIHLPARTGHMDLWDGEKAIMPVQLVKENESQQQQQQ